MKDPKELDDLRPVTVREAMLEVVIVAMVIIAFALLADLGADLVRDLSTWNL